MISCSKPELLTVEHDLSEFDSGEASLNNWLRKKSLKNQAQGASRCFVILNTNKQVIGYYTLTAGAIAHEASPKSFKRNMPNPLPILLLGRLAIDKKHHNKGLGSALLRDAMLRAINVSSDTGIFAILVHALSNQAKQFYLSRGFVECPVNPLTLMVTLKTVKRIPIE